jgi:hypothetical protein
MSIELLSTVLWKNHSFSGFYFILRFFVLFLFLFFPFLFSVFLFFCLFVCLFVCFFLTFFIFFIFSCIIYVIKIQIPNEPCQIIPSPKPRKWKTCVLQGIIWLHLQNCASKKSGPLHIQWMSEWVVVVKRQLRNVSAISWREQVNFQMKWWWGPLYTRPTHLVGYL